MATRSIPGTSLRHALSFGISVSLLLSGGCAPVSENAADQRELGVRAGVLVPGTAEEGSSPSFAVGVFSAGRIPAAFGPPQSPFEVGILAVRSEIGALRRQLAALRAEIRRAEAEEGELPRERVFAAAYGHYRPVSDNETPAGRDANRRVDIVVLPPVRLKKVSTAELVR